MTSLDDLAARLDAIERRLDAIESPPKRDPASTTGGSATLATPPRTRHMNQPPPRVPSRTAPSFGFGTEIHG